MTATQTGLDRLCAAAATLAAVACSGPHAAAPGAPAAATPEPAPDRVIQARWDRGAPTPVSVYLGADRARGFFTVGDGAARWTSKVYPMWKATAGDLDGDGRDELVLGIWSSKRRHAEPEPHRTVWVLGWNGRELDELWRGSALARPLIEFAVADLDGDGTAELAALERAADRCVLTAYRWNGFGFAGAARTSAPCNPPRPPRASLDKGELVLP